MNWRRLPAYLSGIVRGVLRGGPTNLLRLAGRSTLTVTTLPDYGFSMLVDTADRAISRPILCTGAYEPHVAKTFAGLLNADSTVIDIGANIGFFSLLAAARCPHGRVVSFEPDPDNFRMLKASVALNRFESRISLHNVAVSDSVEPVYLSDLGDPANSGARFTAHDLSALEARGAEADSCRRIETVVLDELLYDIPVDVIKIDIEGHEPFAFRGMEQLLRNKRPHIVAEFAPGTIQHISKTDPEDLLQLWETLDYAVRVIEPADGKQTPLSDRSAFVATFEDGQRHHADLLLIPKEQL
jgi:FkbM family methyltransferase